MIIMPPTVVVYMAAHPLLPSVYRLHVHVSFATMRDLKRAGQAQTFFRREIITLK